MTDWNISRRFYRNHHEAAEQGTAQEFLPEGYSPCELHDDWIHVGYGTDRE